MQFYNSIACLSLSSLHKYSSTVQFNAKYCKWVVWFRKNKKQAQLTVSSEKKRQRKTAAVSVNIIDRARFCFGASSEDLFGVFGAVIRRDIGEA